MHCSSRRTSQRLQFALLDSMRGALIRERYPIGERVGERFFPQSFPQKPRMGIYRIGTRSIIRQQMVDAFFHLPQICTIVDFPFSLARLAAGAFERGVMSAAGGGSRSYSNKKTGVGIQ